MPPDTVAWTEATPVPFGSLSVAVTLTLTVPPGSPKVVGDTDGLLSVGGVVSVGGGSGDWTTLPPASGPAWFPALSVAEKVTVKVRVDEPLFAPTLNEPANVSLVPTRLKATRPTPP